MIVQVSSFTELSLTRETSADCSGRRLRPCPALCETLLMGHRGGNGWISHLVPWLLLPGNTRRAARGVPSRCCYLWPLWLWSEWPSHHLGMAHFVFSGLFLGGRQWLPGLRSIRSHSEKCDRSIFGGRDLVPPKYTESTVGGLGCGRGRGLE